MTTALRFPNPESSPRDSVKSRSAKSRSTKSTSHEAVGDRPLQARRRPPSQLNHGTDQPSATNPRAAKLRAAKLTLAPLPGATSSPTATQTVVRQLPKQRPMPAGLRLLIMLQRGSLLVTFLLVTAALVVYSTTMYTQQLWSKEYNTLKRMHRSERQMLAANEVLKNQLIQQAEQPGSGLVPKSSDYTITLEPAPLRPAPPPPPVLSKPEAADQSTTPMGY